MSIRYIKEINKPEPIDIIIPAAGLGRRMKCYGPKCLIKIKNNTTILDRQIYLAKKYLNIANIVLVGGFEANKLFNKTSEKILKVENENFATTNVARSIGLGLRVCQRDVLIMYGDLVFSEDTLKFIDMNHSCIISSNTIMSSREVGCSFDKNILENMMYDLPEKWGQMLFLRGSELKIFKRIVYNYENFQIFGFEAINKVISTGGKFKKISDDSIKIIDIDNVKDLEKVKGII